MSRSGVRISGGEGRGRQLVVPRGTRPTEGRVREALFSIWGDRISGSRFLDLFAGSGVVGLEAAGRGALAVVAVEADVRAVRTLGENVDRVGERGIVEVRRATLPPGLARLREERAGPFDLVFADPPYAFTGYEELLEGVRPLLAEDAEVAVEHAARVELPLEVADLVRTDVRRYGESSLSFYRRRRAG